MGNIAETGPRQKAGPRRYLAFAGQHLSVALLFSILSVVPGSSIAAEKGDTSMTSEKSCLDNALERSRCIIQTILEDISNTYTHTGGGGISAIKQDATNTFTVSISQEERVDLLTYEVEVGTDGTIKIVNRSTGTKSRRH